MLTSACAFLFALGATIALAAIAMTMSDYAPDLALLRLRRRRADDRSLLVSWRIMGLPAADASAPRLRASCPAQAGSAGHFPGCASLKHAA